MRNWPTMAVVLGATVCIAATIVGPMMRSQAPVDSAAVVRGAFAEVPANNLKRALPPLVRTTRFGQQLATPLPEAEVVAYDPPPELAAQFRERFVTPSQVQQPPEPIEFKRPPRRRLTQSDDDDEPRRRSDGIVRGITTATPGACYASTPRRSG